MDNKATMHTLNIGENLEADKCQENIPPADTYPSRTGKPSVRMEEHQNARSGGNNGYRAHQTVSFFPFGNTAANCLKPIGNAGQHSGPTAPVKWLDDEFFPEITLLDVTTDSTMCLSGNELTLPVSLPATPVNRREFIKKTEQVADMKLNSKLSSAQIPKLELESALSQGGELSSSQVTSNISTLDVSKNNTSSSAPGGRTGAEGATVDIIQTSAEELSSTSTCNGNNTTISFSERSDLKSVEGKKATACLEVTRDISVSSSLNGTGSLELSGKNTVEGAAATRPANITCDINSSHDMSASCPPSRAQSFQLEDSNSSKNLSSQQPNPEPEEASNPKDAAAGVPQTSRDAELSSEVARPAQKACEFPQSDQLSVTTDLDSSSKICGRQNKTLDLTSSDVSGPTLASGSTDATSSVHKSSAAAESPVLGPAVKATGLQDVQHTTLDSNEIQKSSNNAALGGAGGTFCVDNSTFDGQAPKSSESHQNDKASPEVVNAITHSEDDASDEKRPPLSDGKGRPDGTETSPKVVNPEPSPSEADPMTNPNPGADRSEPKDQSLLMTYGLSDSLAHQSMDMENDNKVNTFNLDDTLDLKAASLLTSTPMTNGRITNSIARRDTAASDIPSNIVSDRQTFFKPSAAKSLLPASKPVSQLLRYKTSAALPGRTEPPVSGLPVTRRRLQAKALSAAAPAASQETSGVLTSYKLRSATEASKQPSSGLQKRQLGGRPCGAQRAAAGLRPPAVKNVSTVTTSNIPSKTSQTKRHPLTRCELLPVAKKKKTDAPLCEAEASSCDAADSASNVPKPAACQKASQSKTPREVCANCAELEEKLKMQSKEIQRLKEELRKNKKI